MTGAARRLALATIAVAASACALRAPAASGLVTRGDTLLAVGDRNAALSAYRRALFVDPRCAAAADRLAFWLFAGGEPAAARAVADAALRAGADVPALYADRGLASARLRRWHDAERDLRIAARRTADARYAHLAARLAQRAGRPGRPRAAVGAAR